MIWVVGARGMLGKEVVRRLDRLGMPHVDTDVECDTTRLQDLRDFAVGRSVRWIVNCSGYTAVDRAEDEEDLAYAVNAIGPANLGRIGASLGAKVIHVSTDYVFDGEASSPYTEEDGPSPRGAYGRTKAAGERLLVECTPSHFIVRTAWLYGVGGRNFILTMLKLMNDRDEVSVVDDQRGSPTYAWDLAMGLCAIIGDDSRAYGTYHYANEGETTWYRFACAIYEMGRARGHVKHACRIRPTTSDRYPAKAARPRYSVLSTARFRQAFGQEIPTWQDGLERFFQQLEAR